MNAIAKVLNVFKQRFLKNAPEGRASRAFHHYNLLDFKYQVRHPLVVARLHIRSINPDKLELARQRVSLGFNVMGFHIDQISPRQWY